MEHGQSFRELLAVLRRHPVDFLIVGATAAVIESKLATGRPKDQAVLPLLREVLRQRGKP